MSTPGQRLGGLGGLGKSSDLKQRLLFVLGALIVFRIGTYIPVPGINPAQLAKLFQGQEGSIIGLFNMFSGGALERFSLFALGIMPYISASIIMQLMSFGDPDAGAAQEGRRGRPAQDHPVHALRHRHPGDRAGARHRHRLRKPGARRWRRASDSSS